MVRSRLNNKYMKNMSEENKTNYIRQRDYCVKLLIKQKITFWQTAKLFFADKTLDSNQFTLVNIFFKLCDFH